MGTAKHNMHERICVVPDMVQVARRCIDHVLQPDFSLDSPREVHMPETEIFT